jgi:hypothetical protein
VCAHRRTARGMPFSSLLHEFAEAVPILGLTDTDRYHPRVWLALATIAWALLHAYIIPIYAAAADALQSVYHLTRYRRTDASGAHSSSALLSGASLGTRLTLAYRSLSTSKRAYMRRMLRSFLYYVFAVVSGFYFMFAYYSWSSPRDFYFVYTPAMDIAFCFAGAHFLFCCLEDWPCRAHMGKSECEQMSVFWGYIVHHILTATAFITATYTHELGLMCVMGLTSVRASRSAESAPAQPILQVIARAFARESMHITDACAM